MWVSMWTLPSTQSQVAVGVKCPISSFTFDLGWVEGHLNNICMLYYCWDAYNVCVTLLLKHTCHMYIVSLLEYYSAVKRDCTTTSLDGSQEPYSESCCVEWKVSSERSYRMLPFMRYSKNNKALKMADRLVVARSWDGRAGKQWGYLAGACRGGLRSDGAVSRGQWWSHVGQRGLELCAHTLPRCCLPDVDSVLSLWMGTTGETGTRASLCCFCNFLWN